MTRRLPLIVAALAVTAAVALAAGSPAAGSTGSTDDTADAVPATDMAVASADTPTDLPPLPEPPSTMARSKSPNHSRSAFWCNYASMVDNPHISRNRTDVSAHGHWEYHSGTCDTATVRLWLYHVRWSPTRGHYWALTDDDTVRRMPRNASLDQRANVRHTCLHQRYDVTFRAVVDVDIDGHPDPNDRPWKQNNVACIPW